MSRVRMRIVIEVEPGVEPIAGVLYPPVGAPQAFRGWLEFTQKLEGIRTAAETACGGSCEPR